MVQKFISNELKRKFKKIVGNKIVKKICGKIDFVIDWVLDFIQINNNK